MEIHNKFKEIDLKVSGDTGLYTDEPAAKTPTEIVEIKWRDYVCPEEVVNMTLSMNEEGQAPTISETIDFEKYCEFSVKVVSEEALDMLSRNAVSTLDFLDRLATRFDFVDKDQRSIVVGARGGSVWVTLLLMNKLNIDEAKTLISEEQKTWRDELGVATDMLSVKHDPMLGDSMVHISWRATFLAKKSAVRKSERNVERQVTC